MAYALKMNGGKKASFQHYEAANRNVEGLAWNEVNKDRIQIGKKPLPYKTEYHE